MTPKPQANKTIPEILLQYRAELKHGLNELAGNGTALDQAKQAIEALITKELYDLHEYMGQFPDDLNLAVMHERIKLIEKERGK